MLDKIIIIIIRHGIIITIVNSLLLFHSLHVFPSMLDPGLNRDFEVHDSQEWVVTVNLSCNVFNNFIFANLLVFGLCLSTHFKDSNLILELDDLHFLVDFHGTVFTSHASVEKLVEINKTLIDFDAHLQKLFLELTSIVELFAEAKTFFLGTEFSKFFEEVDELVLLDFLALVSILGPFLPYFHETNEIILVVADGVV